MFPIKYSQWMSDYKYIDMQGRSYQYHPRSNVYSNMLCTFLIEDILNNCRDLSSKIATGELSYGINAPHMWETTKKQKVLDLVIRQDNHVIFSCEAKSVMTEHAKAQPRVYDELNSSHDIVHQGNNESFAAGLVVINIADTFISPLKQNGEDLELNYHVQPHAVENMISHLEGLPIRRSIKESGFDALGIIVISCDNVTPVTFYEELPAPQEGSPYHYQSFLDLICRKISDASYEDTSSSLKDKIRKYYPKQHILPGFEDIL